MRRRQLDEMRVDWSACSTVPACVAPEAALRFGYPPPQGLRVSTIQILGTPLGKHVVEHPARCRPDLPTLEVGFHQTRLEAGPRARNRAALPGARGTAQPMTRCRRWRRVRRCSEVRT